MERDRLTRLLEEPGKVAREDLSGLRDLTEEYPWFAGAHLLRSMAEHVKGELTSGPGVQLSAAHLPSREVLYELLHGPARSKPEAAPAPSAMQDPPTHAEPTLPRSSGTDPVEAPVAPGNETTQAPGAPTEETQVQTSATPVLANPEAADAGSDILEQQMLEAAIASSYAIRQEVLGAEGTPPALSDGQPVHAEPPPATERSFAQEEDRPAPPATMRVRGRMRFTEWLDVPATAKVGAADPRPLGPQEEPEPADPVSGPAQPLDVGTLVDRFIRSQHPEPRPKAEFFTPQQAAKRSLEEHSGLVTETLAKIYEQQGRLDKAMEAYRKLALKYPEKSAYFAALEKGLQARLNK